MLPAISPHSSWAQSMASHHKYLLPPDHLNMMSCMAHSCLPSTAENPTSHMLYSSSDVLGLMVSRPCTISIRETTSLPQVHGRLMVTPDRSRSITDCTCSSNSCKSTNCRCSGCTLEGMAPLRSALCSSWPVDQ